jgi:hypothetical protein
MQHLDEMEYLQDTKPLNSTLISNTKLSQNL